MLCEEARCDLEVQWWQRQLCVCSAMWRVWWWWRWWWWRRWRRCRCCCWRRAGAGAFAAVCGAQVCFWPQRPTTENERLLNVERPACSFSAAANTTAPAPAAAATKLQQHESTAALLPGLQQGSNTRQRRPSLPSRRRRSIAAPRASGALAHPPLKAAPERSKITRRKTQSKRDKNDNNESGEEAQPPQPCRANGRLSGVPGSRRGQRVCRVRAASPRSEAGAG